MPKSCVSKTVVFNADQWCRAWGMITYPTLALREALVNAVAHTDYQLTGMNIRVGSHLHADTTSTGHRPMMCRLGFEGCGTPTE